MKLSLTKQIQAPPATVFALASDLANAPSRIKAITKIEILTPGPVGAGTRFRETRVMFGKEATEEMTFTVFDQPNRYEMTANSCGCAYLTIFRFVPDGAGTRVEVEFTSRAVTFVACLMIPLAFLFKGLLRKCLNQDLDDLKQAAEGNPSPSP